MHWLRAVEFWHWWVLALVLLVLEVFSPAAFFLWLGISAGIVGLLLWVLPGIPWDYQLLLFSVLSVTTIVVWRSYLRRHPTRTDRPKLNRRGEQYVGRVFTLESPIVNGAGKIRVDDTTWKITGEDCEPGARVRVNGVDGVILLVERES